ncbi:MAG: FixH family protein [Firmicutes bacterium]|nr:FixH family protein [Bacillota bacterium]
MHRLSVPLIACTSLLLALSLTGCGGAQTPASQAQRTPSQNAPAPPAMQQVPQGTAPSMNMPEQMEMPTQTQTTPAAALPQVTLTTVPDPPKAGTPVQVVAHVTYENAPVEDAQLVKFEIWPTGAPMEVHQMLSATSQHNGVYTATYTFPKAGSYQIMYHVTAKGIHVMKPVEVQVQ